MTRHEPFQTDESVMCSCGREFCPELVLRPAAPPALAGSVAWRIELALTGSGRRAAVRVAAEEVRAGHATHEAAGELLAGHDPTLRTDLELALARRRRR